MIRYLFHPRFSIWDSSAILMVSWAYDKYNNPWVFAAFIPAIIIGVAVEARLK